MSGFEFIGVVGFALQSVELLAELIDAVKGAADSLSSIQRDLQALTAILHGLRTRLPPSKARPETLPWNKRCAIAGSAAMGFRSG